MHCDECGHGDGPDGPEDSAAVARRVVGVLTVRCASHRARERLLTALGRTPPSWVSMFEPQCYGVYQVTAAELPAALRVKGVTKHRPRDAGRWMHPI